MPNDQSCLPNRATIGTPSRRYFVCLVSLALCACQAPTSNPTQLSSLSSPSNELAATWSESSAGATTGFVYRLHVHQKNTSTPLTDDNSILRTSSIVDTALRWESDNILQIDCLRGDVYFWINRSVVGDQNIRAELNSKCPKDALDQWIYIEQGTSADNVPEIVSKDPRVQQILSGGNKAVQTTVGLRVLHNTKKVKEVIHIRAD